MNRLPTITLFLGLLVLGAINGLALVRPHKGAAHPLYPDQVKVYPHNHSDTAPAVPVLEFSGREFKPTGQDVAVYLPYSYEDKLATAAPMISVKIFLATFILYFAELLFLRLKKRAA